MSWVEQFDKEFIQKLGRKEMVGYLVSLHEEEGDKFRIYFECQADDPDHAEEQAIDAYPNCKVLQVIELKKLNHA